MNLIEQLGGYETAKAFLNATSFTIDELIMMQRSGLRTQHVEKALLEYRRQHNIFEESDKIVFIDDFMHGELMTVAWTRKGEVWMDEGAKRCTDLSMIRHATDAEIKAGKRLEVNDGST